MVILYGLDFFCDDYIGVIIGSSYYMTELTLLKEYENLYRNYLKSNYESEFYKKFHKDEPILYRKIIDIGVGKDKIESIIKKVNDELFG